MTLHNRRTIVHLVRDLMKLNLFHGLYTNMTVRTNGGMIYMYARAITFNSLHSLLSFCLTNNGTDFILKLQYKIPPPPHPKPKKWVRGRQKETTNRAARHVTDYSIPFVSNIRTDTCHTHLLAWRTGISGLTQRWSFGL